MRERIVDMRRIRKSLKGIYALWYRELKVFLRERARIVSSVCMPLLWLFVFGGGIGSIAPRVSPGVSYQQFIFPGFLAMTIIFNALFNGAYIVWDKRIDFLKEVLVTPLSRTTIFIGKVAGGLTDALLQASILLIIGFFIGVPYTVVSFLLTIVMLFALATGLVSLGLIIGSFMERPESFGLIGTFAIYPLFLLSGALYPTNNLPPWMKVLTYIDPVTYAVDGLRGAILHVSAMSYATNLLVVCGVDVVLILVGTWAFNRMKL
jgi:ABC-2 type transport system permease protein